jgi:hypothetical protein
LHGIGTHAPAMQLCRVLVEVTTAVSPPVFDVQGGSADIVVASIRTSNTPDGGL